MKLSVDLDLTNENDETKRILKEKMSEFLENLEIIDYYTDLKIEESEI